MHEDEIVLIHCNHFVPALAQTMDVGYDELAVVDRVIETVDIAAGDQMHALCFEPFLQWQNQ